MKLGPKLPPPSWRDFWYGLAYALACTAWVLLWAAIAVELVTAARLYWGW